MNKNIYYINLYGNGKKEKNIGFVKNNNGRIFVLLRGITAVNRIECKMYLFDNAENKRLLTSIKIENGYGQASCNWPEHVSEDFWKGIIIPLTNEYCGKCYFETSDNAGYELIKASTSRQEDIIPDEPEKWDNIYKTFQQVHIFPEAQSILLKPKDMVILTKKYHDLSVNSFVLHSYYNYRQLLLFRYNQENDYIYYLGVPGVYYERERRIALLFGFEGFENGEMRMEAETKRNAYIGCFGYYMKQVDI